MIRLLDFNYLIFFSYKKVAGNSTPASSSYIILALCLDMVTNLFFSFPLFFTGVVQASTESYLAGKGSTPVITAKTVADHLAAKLNAKLNYQPSDETVAPEIDGQGGFQKYEEELIINDFPQQARWRVTSKEALAQISEYSDAGITVRGTYYPPGKTVPEGDRKLFLAIESTNELSVQKAKVEITRLLKEELLKLQTSGIHHINKGRYKVL